LRLLLCRLVLCPAVLLPGYMPATMVDAYVASTQRCPQNYYCPGKENKVGPVWQAACQVQPMETQQAAAQEQDKPCSSLLLFPDWLQQAFAATRSQHLSGSQTARHALLCLPVFLCLAPSSKGAVYLVKEWHHCVSSQCVQLYSDKLHMCLLTC
jgi:hypothetical protein